VCGGAKQCAQHVREKHAGLTARQHVCDAALAQPGCKPLRVATVNNGVADGGARERAQVCPGTSGGALDVQDLDAEAAELTGRETSVE
jgi:hypothetical protein